MVHDVAGWLRDVHRNAPRKVATRWVHIPRCVVLDTPMPESHDVGAWVLRSDGWSEERPCVGCKVRATAVQITDEDREDLSRARGIPLKVLLTVYRWARPYAQTPLGEGRDYYAHRATARLRMKDLASEAIHGAAHAPHDVADAGDEPDTRAARRVLRKLQELGLVEVLAYPGQGQTNLFAPHRIEPSIDVPAGLWRNG